MSVPCRDSELINFTKSHQTKDVSTVIGMYDLKSLKIALGLLGRVLVLCYFQKCLKVSVSWLCKVAVGAPQLLSVRGGNRAALKLTVAWQSC